MSTSSVNYVAIGLTILLPLVLSACGTEEVAKADPVVRPAKLIEVTAGSNITQVSFPAIIEASASADLTFEVSGTLTELLVTEGQKVEQNDVVARLDQRSYQNDLDAAQAQFDAAQAEYGRAKRLIAENAIARSAFDQRKSQRNVARNSLDTARKALEDTELRAPFAGVIADIEIEQFQNVGSTTAILLLQSVGAAEAVVQIPSTLIANSGRIEPIETVVILDAAPGVDIPTVFISASARADESTQTFEVKFGFTPPENLNILPGMTGSVQGSYRTLGDEDVLRISVPLTAIGSDGDERFAWKVDAASMTVSRQNLIIGSGIGERVTVLEGLSIGDTIVGAGMSYLHEGMQIRAYEQ